LLIAGFGAHVLVTAGLIAAVSIECPAGADACGYIQLNSLFWWLCAQPLLILWQLGALLAAVKPEQTDRRDAVYSDHLL
jgi:hypothetical protein